MKDMRNRKTTGTGALIMMSAMSMSGFATNSTSTFLPEERPSAFIYDQDFKGMFTFNSSTASVESSYLEEHYNSVSEKVTLTDNDFAFFNVAQDFAQKQVSLEPDFAEALDELLKSQIGSKPSKKRF